MNIQLPLKRHDRTLKAILECSTGESKEFFEVDYKKVIATLEMPQRTFSDHMKALVKQGKLVMISKGGKFPSDLEKNVIIDRDSSLNANYTYVPNPNNFRSDLLCTVTNISQLEKDLAIMEHSLKISPSTLKHYSWWSYKDGQVFALVENGMSDTSKESLGQYMKYVVKGGFDYGSEEYNSTYDKFEELQKKHSHKEMKWNTKNNMALCQDIAKVLRKGVILSEGKY